MSSHSDPLPRAPGQDHRGDPLLSAHCLAGLPSTLLEALRARAVSGNFSRGTILIRQGAADNRLIFVVRGRLRVTRMGDGGRLRTLQLLGAGQCWCAAPVSGPGLSPVNVECLSDAQLLTLHGEELTKLLSGSPAGAMGLAACLGDRLSESMKEAGDGSGTSVSQKLARTLCRLAESAALPEPGHATIEEITHEDLAALVGTVREVVSRALGVLHKQGIVETGRGRIQILDLPRLRSVAAGEGPTSSG